MKALRVLLLAVPLFFSGACALTLEQAPVSGPRFFLDLRVEQLYGVDGKPVGIRVEGESSKGPVTYECRGWDLKEIEAFPQEPRFVRRSMSGEVKVIERSSVCTLTVLVNKTQKLYQCESTR